MPEPDNNNRFQRIEDKLDDLDAKLNDLDKDLTKYRGMFGGVLLVITALVTFAKLFWSYLEDHVSIT